MGRSARKGRKNEDEDEDGCLSGYDYGEEEMLDDTEEAPAEGENATGKDANSGDERANDAEEDKDSDEDEDFSESSKDSEDSSGKSSKILIRIRAFPPLLAWRTRLCPVADCNPIESGAAITRIRPHTSALTIASN